MFYNTGVSNASIPVKRGKTMSPDEYPQARIVPIRMLQPENAEKFLDGLTCIPGIRRVLIHGPGYQEHAAQRTENCCVMQTPSNTKVMISDQPVNMHVLMADVIIEALDEHAIDVVAKYCEDFFEDFSFQILIGKFMKTNPSLSDYLMKKPHQDTYFIGLVDNHSVIEPTIIKQPTIDGLKA